MAPPPAAATILPPAQRHRGYWAGVGRRLLRDRVAMACAAVLLAILLAALLAPWLGLADP